MTKIRSILKSTKDADERYPVLLCISDRGKRAYFSTGFSATEKEFEVTKEGGRFSQGRGVKSFTVERKEEDCSTKTYTNKEANDKLAALEERAHSILRKYNEEHVDWSFEQFRSDFVNAPKRSTFLRFAEDVVEKTYRERGQYSTADTVKYTLTALKKYDSTFANRTFQEITSKYLEDFDRHCRRDGALPSTISIRVRVIKRIFNIAIRDKVIPREIYPFSKGTDDGKYKPPKPKLTKTNQYLPIESLEKLANHKFERPILERDKHIFLFSFHCWGINWKDMAHLKRSNFQSVTTAEGEEISVLRYKRAKTEGEFEVPVSPEIQEELNWFIANSTLYSDYVVPIITKAIPPERMDIYLAKKRSRFNRSLKEIAKELELPESQLNLTSYHARHSFAMAMLTENELPVEVISQALGHQSVKTTKHYLAGFSSTKMAELTRVSLKQSSDD